MATMGGASEGKMADVTIEEIRTWWKVPAIAHFCSLFRGTFSLPDFEIEELEEALFLDSQEEGPSPFLNELLVTLLRGCYQRKDIDHHNYLEFLRDTLKYRWETEEKRVNPLRNEDATFKNLSTLMKVEILNALCDYRLDAPDVSNLKDFYGENLRIEPLGKDGNGALYWYFYGTRLYKEDREPSKDEKEAKRKQRLKEKKKKLRELQAARRKLNQKEKQTKKEKPKKERQSKGKRKKKDESESDDDADDEEPKSKKGGAKNGKNAKTPQKSKVKKGNAGSNDEEKEEVGETPKKRGGKKTKGKEEEEDPSPKKPTRKRKKDTEEPEEKSDKSQKRGRQLKKEVEEDVSPRKRGGSAKKQDDKDRTKKKDTTPKKGVKEVTPRKRGGRNSKDTKDESVDEESDNQPLAKLKDSPTKSEEGITPKKRGRGKQVKEEEESPQPKKRGGRTPAKKVKEEEEVKTPPKRSRAKKVKEETEIMPKKVVKGETKSAQTSPRGKKLKEEIKTENDSDLSDKKVGENDIKEETCEETNTDEASQAPSTATSIPVSSEESSDDDLDELPRWHLACHTEEDWVQLTEKLKKSRLKCERELYKILVNDFLPEIKSLFAENERELRKRLMEMAPKRVSDRIVTLRIKAEEEERMQSSMKAEADARRKAAEQDRQARRERARSLQQKKDSEEQEKETKRRIEARAKRAKLREKRLEYIREGKAIPEELQKEFDSNSSLRWKSRVDDDEEETYLGLCKVLEAIKTHPDSWPFLEPVSETYAPGYYNIIKFPMDITTMERKLHDKVYASKDEFVNDMHQIFQNCVDYNGPSNEYTIMAETLENAFDESMDEHFPDDEDDSETDDEEFTSAAYYRELRGIRRTPLRHTSRNTSASRAKMEMSVHTMMQSSSAESSPHNSDYSEYEDGSDEEDGLENGNGSDVPQKDKDGKNVPKEAKNFQQGFENFVKLNSPPNSLSKSGKSKKSKNDPDRAKKNSETNEKKKRTYTKRKSKTDGDENDDDNNADGKGDGDIPSEEGGDVTKTDSQSNDSNNDNKVDPSKVDTSCEQYNKSDPSQSDPSKNDPSKNDTSENCPSKGDQTMSEHCSKDNGAIGEKTNDQESKDQQPKTDSCEQSNMMCSQNGPVEGSQLANLLSPQSDTGVPLTPQGGESGQEPMKKKRKYTKKSPKWEELKLKKAAKEAAKYVGNPDQGGVLSPDGSVGTQNGEEQPRKKRQYRRKEQKEGADAEKKTRKRRTKKEMQEASERVTAERAAAMAAANAAANAAQENIGCNPSMPPSSIPPSDVDNNNIASNPAASGRIVDAGGQTFVLHKVDCEPGKFSPSIDGHEAKIIRVPNPMHSANMNLTQDQAKQTESHEISIQTDNPPPHDEVGTPRYDHSQMQGQDNSAQMNSEWGGEPPKAGSVLGQFLNPQEHNFLQGNVQQQHQKDYSSESYSRDGSVSSEQYEGQQRPPPSSNFVPQSSPPYYPPHMSDYQSGPPMSHDQGAPMSHDQPQPQPLMSNVSQDSLHHHQQQQGGMIDLNSRRPPHPYQGPPPPRQDLSQPGLPSAFQRLPYNQPNPEDTSQDGYSQPSVITKVPPPLPSGGSDHSMPPNTQQTDTSGNTCTSDGVYGSRPAPPEQYSRQQFSPHGSAYSNMPPYWDRNMSTGYNAPPAGNYNLSSPPPNPNLSSPPPNPNISSPPLNPNAPPSSTVPSLGQEQLPERPPERSPDEQPATKLWRPHTNGPQETDTSYSRPPIEPSTAENQSSEYNKTVNESQPDSNKNSMLGSLLNKSPPPQQQQGSSEPTSPAMSNSSHRGGGENHGSFTSPRPPSPSGNGQQQPLAGAGSPLHPPQTSPAVSQQNSLPPPSPLLAESRVNPSPHIVDSRGVPQSPHLSDPRVPPSPHMSESRLPLTSPSRPLTSPRSTAGDSTAGDNMPSSMQGLVNSASRGMNYMSMLNSDPTGMQMQEYLAEAERMRRTPSAHAYMDMNGSRFGLSPSPSPYASHAMQQMGQSSSMYGGRLPMPATQPLPASFSSYGVAASPHLRQLLHNRIPGASPSQPGMMSHSAYATQSPLGMGLGPTSGMYAGYDRQSPYSAGYNMQQAAEFQYYQQRSQALHKSAAAGYYPQPGVSSQYLDTQAPNPRAPYNPSMMGTGHLPPGYE